MCNECHDPVKLPPNCTACSDLYSLDSKTGKCVCNLDLGFYIFDNEVTSEKECRKCDKKCKLCTSELVCTVCSSVDAITPDCYCKPGMYFSE